MKFFLREGIDFQPQGPNALGTYHVQLFQAFPMLEPFYMQWEKEFDPQPVLHIMKSVPWVPVSVWLESSCCIRIVAGTDTAVTHHHHHDE